MGRSRRQARVPRARGAPPAGRRGAACARSTIRGAYRCVGCWPRGYTGHEDGRGRPCLRAGSIARGSCSAAATSASSSRRASPARSPRVPFWRRSSTPWSSCRSRRAPCAGSRWRRCSPCCRSRCSSRSRASSSIAGPAAPSWWSSRWCAPRPPCSRCPRSAAALLYAGTLIVFSANRLFQATSTAVIPRVVGSRRGATRRRPGTAPERRPALHRQHARVRHGDGGLVRRHDRRRLHRDRGGHLGGDRPLGGDVGGDVGRQRAALQHPAAARRRPALRGELAAVVADLADGFRRIGRTPAALAPVLTVAVGQFLQVMVIATVLVVIEGGSRRWSRLVLRARGGRRRRASSSAS